MGEHVTSLYAAYLDIDEDKVIYIFDESNKPEEHFDFLAKMDITHPYIMSGNTEEWKSDFIIMFKKELLKKGLCKENASGSLFALSDSDSQRMRIGQRIAQLRKEAGMSQAELAEKIGVTRRVICSYENDKSRPRGTERYKKLAEALNVNVNYLLSEDDAFIADVEDKYGRRGARLYKAMLSRGKLENRPEMAWKPIKDKL